MGQRADELSARFAAFNDEVVKLVENCSDDDWHKLCEGEGWSVGVVTHHVAAGHYGVLAWAKMIVEGQELPGISIDAIHQANAQHAQEHAGCTKEEVLALLSEGGGAIAEYVTRLSDADLDRTACLEVMGGDISAQQFIENLVINSSSGHLASAKATVGV